MSLGTEMTKEEGQVSLSPYGLNVNWQRETAVDGLRGLAGRPRLREYLHYCQHFEKKCTEHVFNSY